MDYPLWFSDRREDNNHDIVDGLANLIERVNTDELRNEPATQAILYAQEPEFREQQERKNRMVYFGTLGMLLCGISAGGLLSVLYKK